MVLKNRVKNTKNSLINACCEGVKSDSFVFNIYYLQLGFKQTISNVKEILLHKTKKFFNVIKTNFILKKQEFIKKGIGGKKLLYGIVYLEMGFPHMFTFKYYHL